jgi:hypothetical protein
VKDYDVDESSDGPLGVLEIGSHTHEPCFKVVAKLRLSTGCNALLSSVLRRAELAWAGGAESRIGSDMLHLIN